MPLINQNAVLCCNVQSNPSTVASVLNSDAILVNNAKFTPSIEMNKRNPMISNLSPYSSIPGKRSAKMSFEVELVGASAAGALPHWSDAMLGCGFAVTTVTGSSVSYQPSTSSTSTCTLGLYNGGKLYKLWGAKGNVRIVLENGKAGKLFFEFTGQDFTVTDVALPTGMSYETTLPPAFQGATLTIDSYAACVNMVEFNMNNKVALRPCASEASGNSYAIITDRETSMKFDPEEELVATEDFFGNWRSGALMAFSAAFGSAAGNTFTITADDVQYQDCQLAEREGITTLDINSLCTGDSGDDEIVILIE